MSQEGFKRKLTAILSADVVGYSRLMRDDEEATVRDVAAHRILIFEIIKQNQGRVIDSPGDNILAEFGSVVDAVNGAIQIQGMVNKRNADVSDNRKMKFRIGVNLGDVIEEDDHIYGDGVNIAARIEGLASDSGIAISGTVYEHIKDKLSLGYHYLGEQRVKNIPEPLQVYRLLTKPGDAGKLIGVKNKASVLKRAFLAVLILSVLFAIIIGGLYRKYIYLPTPINIDPQNTFSYDLPTGPSIAVLPFDNMTGDPDQEFFCDGITENIISALSQTPKLFVIARNSTFAFRDKRINVQQIGRELNAAYIIEGSIQKSDKRIRITVQLIDTNSGHHLWSERYSRDLKDIFELQDEITLKIIKAMQINLSGGEQFRSRFEGIDNLRILVKLFKAFDYFYRLNIEGNNLSKKVVNEIIEIDPNISIAYSLLAAVYLQDLQYGACNSNIVCFGQATEATRKAIFLDEENSDAHLLAGWLFGMKKDHDNAISSLKRAILLNPNNAHAYDVLGWILAMAGEPSEGIKYIKKAFRLNPIPPAFYYIHLGICYRDLEEYEKAITAYKKSINIQPENIAAHISLIITYILSGKESKANELGLEVLKINPDFSVEKYVKAAPIKEKEQAIYFRKTLLKAGLPE